MAAWSVSWLTLSGFGYLIANYRWCDWTGTCTRTLGLSLVAPLIALGVAAAAVPQLALHRTPATWMRLAICSAITLALTLWWLIAG